MADEVWPRGVLPRTAFVHLQNRSGQYRSAYTGGGQVAVRAGAREWVAELNFESLTRAQSGQIAALVARLGGAAGTVLVPDFERIRPAPEIRDLNVLGFDDTQPAVENPFSDTEFYFADTGFGFALGPPLRLEAAVSKGASSLTMNGFKPNIVVARPGDSLSVDNRLYLIRGADDVVSDSGGLAVFDIAPAARQDHEVSAVCTLSVPVCRMRLSDEDTAGLASKIFKTVTLRFIEAAD